MEAALEKLLLIFTLFSGWSFRSSGKKRLKDSPETRSEPSTPKLATCSKAKHSAEMDGTSRPVSTTQPIAIKGRTRAASDEGRSYAHSLPKSYKSTPDSTASSTPRSLSSSQYNSMHDQIWQQAFRNGCR